MNKNILWIIMASVAGMLFAGYLTFTKMILGVCPLAEPCPTLWGYASCIYGLILFFTMFVSALTLNAYPKDKIAKNVLRYSAVIAVIFALYSIYQELFVITCPGGCTYSLLLPTCIYGLIFYLIVTYNAFRYK